MFKKIRLHFFHDHFCLLGCSHICVCGHSVLVCSWRSHSNQGRSYLHLQLSEYFKSPSSLVYTISMSAQIKVSLDSIVSFLQFDDLQPDVIEKLSRGRSDTAIEIVDGNFCWDLSFPNPTLKDINFKVCHGMRVAVCGTVGSGKSSLLSCILGEVPKISGTIKVSGMKAYVAQSPWIQSGKIEENILFCKEMDRERCQRVLDACSLKDLEILSFDDQTVIGERGINLGGRQKQRIQIARALYQDADIFLFDDPFSAVDAHTGIQEHIFSRSACWGCWVPKQLYMLLVKQSFYLLLISSWS